MKVPELVYCNKFCASRDKTRPQKVEVFEFVGRPKRPDPKLKKIREENEIELARLMEEHCEYGLDFE